MSEFKPSDEQRAIFDTFLNGSGNLTIAALAGTGKTTTLVEMARLLPKTGSKIFCAFNKAIAAELADRLKGTGMEAKTFHAIGRAGLVKHLGARDLKLESKKYKAIAEQLVTERAVEFEPLIRQAVLEQLGLAKSDVIDPSQFNYQCNQMQREVVKMLDGVCQYLRLHMVDWNNLDGLFNVGFEYGAIDPALNDELIDAALALIAPIMKEGERQVEQQYTIDFTDMIYWPVKWDVSMYQYMFVFVDECQDLSPVQRTMIRKIIWRRGGRIVLVGDPHQAIYAFAGADSDSFDLSVQMFDAAVLPLTLTRRCAQVITEHAAKIVPEFRCPAEAPRGRVVWLDENRLITAVKPGDMIVCRLKAPLISACLDLLAKNIPATVIGSDIGRAIVSIVEKASQGNFDTVLQDVNRYIEAQVARWTQKEDEDKVAYYQDMGAAALVLVERYLESKPAFPSFDGLAGSINALFSDENGDNLVRFSTIHKAKGLEANRVFILKPESLPLYDDEQEHNLDYVARTRAKRELYYLTNSKFFEKQPTRHDYVEDYG